MASEPDARSSISEMIDANRVLSINHPIYLQFSSVLMEEVAAISAQYNRDADKRRKVLITTALQVDEVARLTRSYSEFTIVTRPLNRPVHAYFSVARRLANELMLERIGELADDILHFGGLPSEHMARGNREVHVEAVPGCVPSLQELHADAVDIIRLYPEADLVAKDTGVVLHHDQYRSFINQEAFVACQDAYSCTHACTGAVFDLTLVSMGPRMLAAKMMQHGARFAEGVVIYHPMMLIHAEGELPGMGIHYSRGEKTISFRYPEGECAVAEYDVADWVQWLVGHSFTACRRGSGARFHVELARTVECFLFFRVVRADAASVIEDSGPVQHALELALPEPMTVVSSWRLRDLIADPGVAASWEREVFLVESRVVNKAYEYAMSVEQGKLTRHTVRTRIKAIVARVVVQGTSVEVHAMMSSQQEESLINAVMVRAFVDRYEASRLTTELMAHLKAVRQFADATKFGRMAMVAQYVMRSGWDATVGRTVDGFADMAYKFADYITGRAGKMRVEFQPVPEYVPLEVVDSIWRRNRVEAGGILLKLGYREIAELNERTSRNFWSAAYADMQDNVVRVVRESTDVVSTRVRGITQSLRPEELKKLVTDFVGLVSSLNPLDFERDHRHHLEQTVALRRDVEPEADEDPCVEDPVQVLNTAYNEALPGLAVADIVYDVASRALDDQDISLSAVYLKLPGYFGLPPKPRLYYVSRLLALNVPMRPESVMELLSAVVARNLNAPVVALPQDEEPLIVEIFETFKRVACVADVDEKLALYQRDPLAMGAEALTDWVKQAQTGKVEAAIRELREEMLPLEQQSVDDYVVMLKADAKPTLSQKPLLNVTEPQVIVYHKKAMSAMFSAIFRVIVRRLLSLLKPNFLLLLLKDPKDITQLIDAYQPFGQNVRYLENDFSKFDKSQGGFVFRLEAYIFGQLGLSEAALLQWFEGHETCHLRSFTTGLSLHVMYQRKSGDATTALGNGLLNMVSVVYAYQGMDIAWLVCMGDDSLACVRAPFAVDEVAVRRLSEIFNLLAKFYITDAPYFASNFVAIDTAREKSLLLPDPIKRVERMSMMIASDGDVDWGARHVSFTDAMRSYLKLSARHHIAAKVAARYLLSVDAARSMLDALATLVNSPQKFRDVWEDMPVEYDC